MHQRSIELVAPKLLRSLKWMLRSRYLEDHMVTLQRNGYLYLWLSNRGQEAASAGVLAALSEEDYIFPSYREHIIPLSRGVAVEQLLAPFSGIHSGGWDPRESNCHIYTFILGAQVLHSTGFAMAEKLKVPSANERRITVTFFGDGASTQGAVHEAFVFAANQMTSQLFVLQDNQWAISTPSYVQSKVPLVRRGYGYGFRSREVDGDDFFAVYETVQQCVSEIREGSGPQFLVLKTTRVDGHATSDAPQRYRDVKSLKLWHERNDPIVKFEDDLCDAGIIDRGKIQRYRDEAQSWARSSVGNFYDFFERATKDGRK